MEDGKVDPATFVNRGKERQCRPFVVRKQHGEELLLEHLLVGMEGGERHRRVERAVRASADGAAGVQPESLAWTCRAQHLREARVCFCGAGNGGERKASVGPKDGETGYAVQWCLPRRLV
jgi:hypothetical protein